MLDQETEDEISLSLKNTLLLVIMLALPHFILLFFFRSADFRSMTTIRRHQYFMMVYMKSHTRCGGYMIGIIGGFSLLTLQKRGYCFSKVGRCHTIGMDH